MLINFDFDGVIADSFDSLFHLLYRAWQEVGVGREPVPEDLRSCNDLTFEGLARMLEIPERLEKSFRMSAHRLMLSSADQAPALFDGIDDVIRRLSEHHAITVVTANVEQTVRRSLAGAQLNDAVELVLDGGQPGSKSDKLLQACRHFGVSPGEAVMVGDAVSDIREGKKAGVATIAVAWGYQSVERLGQQDPDLLATTPGHLPELIDSLA